MMRAAHESIHMEGMMEASEKPMVFRKLDEKSKNLLNRKNPVPPHHPTYLSMIKDAVLALNASKGVSKPALLKYLAQHYQLGENLPKTKGHGASGSFKLGKMAKIDTKRSARTRHVKKATKARPSSMKAKRSVKNKLSKPVGKARKLVKPRKASKAKVKARAVKRGVKSATGRHRVQKKRGVAKNRAPRAKKA
uniref:H15 domain-containing protein n=1 Tax=Angiostrongylus cantonensis TaxID=6313 RepID=A0A0K0CXG3_ANGCA